MALSTFAELKTAIASWAWGEVTTALIGTDFFPMMQSKMYLGDGDGRDGMVQIQPLRIRAMEDSATITPTAGAFTISSNCGAGWLEFTSLKPTNAYGKTLSYLEPFEFKHRSELTNAGTPEYYTIENDTVTTGPYSSTTIAARWYEKFTALSADGDTDWVLTNAPQVYLNGCLMEACAYLQDEREGQFRGKFAAGINALNRNNAVAKSSGSIMRAIPRVSV